MNLPLVGLLALAGTVAVAAPQEKKFPKPPIDFPARHGAVVDYFPGKKGKPKQIVVMIQDLHANVGVQKNIKEILFRLLEKNTLPRVTVCVEGASGEGDVSLIRSLPRGVRRLFEDMLLRKAYLTGAELAATEASANWEEHQAVWGYRMKEFFKGPQTELGPVTLSPILLWGVDDPDLYRKNWRAAKFVDKNRLKAMEEYKQIRQMLMPGANPALQKHLGLVSKLLMLRLQPQEYYDYLKSRPLTPKGSPLYQETVKAADLYYEMAEARSVAMSDNLLKRMGGTPGYTALISGGFHTEEMSQQLTKRNVAHMVVRPMVRVLDQDPAYLSRLREEE